ncbi:hypothetical protein HO133_000774 [Letharia lupina]|uniref:Nudix hydrolase domain-containing protein n=1 Tax=Letharia lupina TaxID=560253 RepID=A0A8H6FBW3_9LECA|nr:uncharacterized protein HO133_000774 [Letharia lupina]KAF6222727.1 hypothetical protein HO133_000774 [Letharia lupina]
MSQKAGLYQEHTNIPKAHLPIVGNWDSANTTIGAGVAIFHLASSRVVLCYHSTKNYYFLPKGRRDASEDTGSGAEREGFEESGYRNRLLPLPIPTRQPKAHNPSPSSAATTPFVTEPVWTQLVPVTRTAQYILFWYIAETVPPDLEVSLSAQEKEQGMAYQYPPKFSPEMTLKERMEMEREGYEPIRHENTGVDAEEALYESYLMPVEEAIEKLGRGISADVVRKGWEAIQLKHKMEDGR